MKTSEYPSSRVHRGEKMLEMSHVQHLPGGTASLLVSHHSHSVGIITGFDWGFTQLNFPRHQRCGEYNESPRLSLLLSSPCPDTLQKTLLFSSLSQLLTQGL